MTQAEKLIDALNGTFGRHKGYRASHAKGFAATGRFLPASPRAAVEIPLLRSEQPVFARFSVGGGKPAISDKSPTVRGVGLTIGSEVEIWSMALISAPVFFANSGQQLREFLAARVPDPEIGGPNPEKVKAFNAANPNTVPHQEYLKATAPCRCYSTENYHSGHAYGFTLGTPPVDARLLLEPEAGRTGLTDEELADVPDDYLHSAMLATLSDGPARWILKLLVANTKDELLDPTVPWVGKHREVSLGTVEIKELDAGNIHQARVFDPACIPAGVDAPKDEVFPLRSAAYAVSKSRRSEQRS
ncbi:MAG: catalase [Roseibium sp.]|uniref:catalase n=1 Tax=Roseibium sp. TaxID=1936156 RepID=UPI00261AFF3C|nr:catalase [Roseibium sp.]MCV0425194.1 catalase [Roseibium sp.]